jgi:hypothetical protein
MKEITFDELLAQADKKIHHTLLNMAYDTGTEGFIVFENLQLDSSSLGQRTFVVYGPDKTYKSPKSAEDSWLNDLPSQRQYPTAFCRL